MAEVQSLARGLKILDLLASAKDGLGITEIARHLGVDKSSAFRLAQTLAQYGYAQQDSASRKYWLGPQSMTLSRSFLGRMSLRDQARPYLRELVDQTGEAAHLAVWSRGQALIIEDIESPARLRVDTGVGRFTPLHSTAVGKSLLAFCNVPVPVVLTSLTARTITDPDQLRLHLDQVRQQAYAFDDEENTEGVRCLAVPIYDHSGEAVGAIGISGPTVRMTIEQIPELAAIVIKAGQALSAHLDFQATT